MTAPDCWGVLPRVRTSVQTATPSPASARRMISCSNCCTAWYHLRDLPTFQAFHAR
jgi:hypothetical protein